LELENLGFNALTISFFATIFFSLLAAWGLIDQDRKIWSKKSGQSLSSIWFICASFFFLSNIIYGIETRSIALTFGGFTRGSIHIPILFGIKKFKGFSRADWLIIVLLSTLSFFMAISGQKGTFFLVFSLGVMTLTALQPLEIWRQKASGVVSIKMLIIYTVSSIFWIVYSVACGDTYILIMTLGFLTLFLVTILLWFRYKEF